MRSIVYGTFGKEEICLFKIFQKLSLIEKSLSKVRNQAVGGFSKAERILRNLKNKSLKNLCCPQFQEISKIKHFFKRTNARKHFIKLLNTNRKRQTKP